MIARDSVTVILLVLATKMVKIYLFKSSLVHFRRIEPKKMLDAVKNRDVTTRAIQVLFIMQIGSSRSANTVERKI